MPLPKSEAIVLKSYDLRETSKIVHFYTKEFGKIHGVLKGIRKDPGKFGSTCDQFSVNDIVYYPSRNELHLVGQCDMKEFFAGIRGDLQKLTAASYAVELVGKIMPLEEKNAHVYELLLNYLSSLQTTDDINKLVHMFQIKILLHSGFRPHLDSCVITHKPINGPARFSMKKGGLVSNDVEVREDQVVPVTQGAINSILYIEKNDWDNCLRLGLPTTIKDELKYILNNFLVLHMEQHIKSMKFLAA